MCILAGQLNRYHHTYNSIYSLEWSSLNVSMRSHICAKHSNNLCAIFCCDNCVLSTFHYRLHYWMHSHQCNLIRSFRLTLNFYIFWWHEIVEFSCRITPLILYVSKKKPLNASGPNKRFIPIKSMIKKSAK